VKKEVVRQNDGQPKSEKAQKTKKYQKNAEILKKV